MFQVLMSNNFRRKDFTFEHVQTTYIEDAYIHTKYIEYIHLKILKKKK